MIPIHTLFEKTLEVPDEGVHPFELIQLARKKNLIKSSKSLSIPELKDGEFAVPMIDNGKKKKIINPLTGREKGKKNSRYLITTVKPEDRSTKNLPRYAPQGSDKRGKPKVRFQDWLVLKKSPIKYNKYNDVSWGWSPNGKCYGWSHRAMYGFKVGDKIKEDTIGNWKKKEWTIKTEEDAERMAKEFAREVS